MPSWIPGRVQVRPICVASHWTWPRSRLDSGRAANLLAEIKPRLTVAEQQQLAREFAETVDARACSSPAQPSAGGASKPAGSSSNAANLALDLARMTALSIAGIFDPTPTCDTIDGVISLLRGDYVGAGISALSMIPYLGDAAKLGKLSKFAETVGMAVEDLAKSNVQFGEQDRARVAQDRRCTWQGAHRHASRRSESSDQGHARQTR